MVDNSIQPAQQPNSAGTVAAAEAKVFQAKTTRDKIAALAEQFQVSPRVARSLYRGIVKKDPQASVASLLAQFAQAVSKRKLAQTNKTQQKKPAAASSSTNATDTLTRNAAANQFFAALPASNTSGLSQQAFKQVTQNPQSGPVLPPPKPPTPGTQVPSLGTTLSKSLFLNPQHPNWQAFEVLLMDSMNDHAIDRMMWSQLLEQGARNVQITSLETGAETAEADIWGERRDAEYGMAGSVVNARMDYLEELSKKLVNANPVDDPNSLDFKNATIKPQHIGPIRDRWRGGAMSVMSGMRDPGSEDNFMDADRANALAGHLDPRSRTTEQHMKHQLEPYLARQDAESAAKRQGRKRIVEDLQSNRGVPDDLDHVILGQAIPGAPTEADINAELAASRVERRFYTKAEIETLSPAEKQQYQQMMKGFSTARMSDITDRVQALQQEVGRLRSGAQLARGQAVSPSRCPAGTDVELYKKSCEKMGHALDKKANDLTTEQLNGTAIAKQVLQNEVFSNRISMRSTMQHAEWLQGLQRQLNYKIKIGFEKNDPTDEFNMNQREQVCRETLYAINRRIDDLYQSMKPFRGDAHQPKSKPLRRNERLDKFESAPGAAEYNAKWDAYEALQAKEELSPADHVEMTELRTFLYEMRDGAPANVWEPWKLDRLHTKLEQVRNDSKATTKQVQDAETHFSQAMDIAVQRVDKDWLSHLMNTHIKERSKILTREMQEKVLGEADPAKKAALLKEQQDLKSRLNDREVFWAAQFNPSKLNTAKQKAKSAITALGLGPTITYNMRNNHVVAKPQPVKGHAAEEVEAQKAHQQDPIVCDHDDTWLEDGEKFKHIDPGVDYKDQEAVNSRLEAANAARGAALAHWNDQFETTATAVVKEVAKFGQDFSSNMSVNKGIASNFAQEGADMAGGSVQELKGDFDAMYAQIMAMRTRLLPLIGKISPWG